MAAAFSQGMFNIDPNATPDQIRRKRAIMDAMASNLGSKSGGIPGGIVDLITGIAIGAKNRNIDQFEQGKTAEAEKALDAFSPQIGAFMNPVGGASQSPMQTAQPSAWDGQDIKGGIQETANALGISPVDLATAISYETAGTFDPVKTGPTTQWGQHKGLIQFGEPQAKEYGVDWNDPVGSQLGAKGAIAKYLTNAGVEPGMGMKDIYSAINAGRVGRYNASDANNGGAPGTVSDKVEGQMAGHRAKAMEMFGGSQAPDQRVAQAMQTGQGSGFDLGGAIAVLNNPYLPESKKQVLRAMVEQEFKTRDPKYQLETQDLRNRIATGAPDYMSPADRARIGMDQQRFGLDERKFAADQQNRTLTDDIREYNFYADAARKAGQQPLSPDQFWTQMKKAGSSSTNVTIGDGPNDAELRKSLDKKTGELWSTYEEQATNSASMSQDMAVLDELIKVAPQGPIEGRIASMFPGFNSAGDAFQSVVKRVAPTLRAPGSGSTSDIEYDGMLKSLPALQNKPEANAAIAQIMKEKARINIERGNIVSAYSQGKIGAAEARRAISEIDKQSIMTPEMKSVIDGLKDMPKNDAPEGVPADIWEVMTPEERALWQN